MEVIWITLRYGSIQTQESHNWWILRIQIQTAGDIRINNNVQVLDDYLDLRLSAANIPRTGRGYMQIYSIPSLNMHIRYSERVFLHNITYQNI